MEFSSRDVPAALRREAVEAAYSRHVALTIDFPDKMPVADMVLCEVGQSQIARMTTSPVRMTTSPDDTGMLYIGITEAGSGIIGADRDGLCVRTGDVQVMRRERRCLTVVSEPSAVLSIALPIDALVERVGHGDWLARPLSLSTPAARMLRAYALGLIAETAAPSDSEAAMFSRHLADLAAMMLGARGVAADRARRRGGRAERRAEVHADIRRRLADPDLSIDAVARRQGVSPAYVRALFYDQGTSFTLFVQDERLALVDRLLRDRTRNGHTIAALALEAGFGDISWFNQLFRRRYGITPSRHRQACDQIA